MTHIYHVTKPRKPLPGSPEAIELGCECSPRDNHLLFQRLYEEKMNAPTPSHWLVVSRCPVHAQVSVDPEQVERNALLQALQQVTAERDRYFYMKRVNAGLYATARKWVQELKAIVLSQGSSLNVLEQARQYVGNLPSVPDEHVHRLLDCYSALMECETDDKLRHLSTMCALTQDWIDRGETDKAHRWLGFIQGVLWIRGFYTIEQLRDHIQGSLP